MVVVCGVVEYIFVNDGSNEEKENIPELKYIKSVKILNMKQNQGHARCNAMGLKYLYEILGTTKGILINLDVLFSFHHPNKLIDRLICNDKRVKID